MRSGSWRRSPGRDLDDVPAADEDARAALVAEGLSPWLAGMAVEYGRAFAAGWGDFTTTDVQDVVGRPPRAFADFARDHAAAFTASRADLSDEAA